VIAESLGVGRGSDLIMYFFFVAAIFFGILFDSKMSRLERSQTELVRELAILTARSGERPLGVVRPADTPLGRSPGQAVTPTQQP
jgi:hypothetical protein